MPPNHQTNGATPIPVNSSSEPPVDIATELSDHDPAYTDGSKTTPANGSNTITPINGSIKYSIDIATKVSHHEPSYTNDPTNTQTNGSTTALLNGSTKPSSDIATEFSHPAPSNPNDYANTPTNDSTTTPINGSTKLPANIITEFSHHDLSYTNGFTNTPTNGSASTMINGSTNTSTNGSTKTPINSSTKTQIDIATKFSHHDPAYTNCSTNTPIDGSVITLINGSTTTLISTESSNHDTTYTNGSITTPTNDSTTTPLDIATEFSHHDPAFARLNNGSFGCCPSTIISVQKQCHLKFLENPELFYFNTLQPSLLKSRHVIKTLINANDVDEISLLDNVTTAAATVLSHTAWSFFTGDLHPGDSALILQKAYGAVKKSVGAYVSRAGGHVIEVPLPFPINSKEEIISEFKKALETGKCKSTGTQKIKLALIDHVTSIPSIVIPVKELVQLCRDEGVEKIFIDGAHGIGCVDVDVSDIGADYYTSSLYKWFFCPPAAAFLYCKKAKNSVKLHHPIVSHEYGNGLPAESGWIGTRDYSPQCMIPEVFEFMMERFEGGIEGIRRRNHEKVVEMAEMLAREWGTGLGAPPEMCSSMAMVGLPGCLGISSDGNAWDLMERLRSCFRVLVPVWYREPLEGDGVGVITGYVRISHQVYNKVEDYLRLRDAVKKLVYDGFTYKANKKVEIINT